MHLTRTTLAIPGESLADISPDQDEAVAGNLLATWTALWDPALLAHTRKVPTAKSVDAIVGDPRDPHELVVIPKIARSGGLDDWQPDDPLVVFLDTFGTRSEVIARLGELLPGQLKLATPLATDFYAFGYAYVQIELLTRSMHFDSQVAQEALQDAIVAAADAALAGDESTLADELDHVYDQLMQSRNHYYPIDFYLVDLLLTAPSVSGRPLAEACSAATQSNVLVTGELIDHLAAHEPESLAAMRQAWDEKRLAVCGGSMTGEPLNQLSPEALLFELRAGTAAIEQHLGRRATVFAHPAGPMAPLVPGVLYRLGYHATMLANFAGGGLPTSHGSRTTWTGLDGTPIEALAAKPIDVGSNSAMLALARRMQHTMNYDLAASLLLVGWPGHRSEWHADLLQVAKRSSLLGRPITLDEYFDVTSSHDYAGATRADAYPSATHVRADEPDDDPFAALARIAGAEQPTSESLAELLTGTGDTQSMGTLWLNATSLPRQHCAGELPAFGWRWEPLIDHADHPPRCEAGVLRNEHMEVVFDDRTGGISATRLHAYRGNYLSQQLVVEPLGPQGIAAGLQLAFDGWSVATVNDTTGRLASDYRVVDRDGHALAKVRQLSSLARQEQSLDVRVEWEPVSDRAEICRLTNRIAVRDEGYAMSRGLQGVDLPTTMSQVTAAWLGIGGEPVPLALLCDRPRMHRRHSGRMLDTRLVEAAGEKTVASLSYLLDCRYPAQEYATCSVPQRVFALPARQPRQPDGWWLRLGAKNLLVTHLAAEATEGDLLVRMRVLETAGRPTTTRLAAWQPITDARQVNFLGEPDQLLSVADGEVRLSMAPYEFAEIEVLLGGGQ